MPGLAGEEDRINAKHAKRRIIFALLIHPEEQIRIRWRMEPGVGLQLVFELPCGPAGIAQSQKRAIGPLPARDRLEDIDRDGQSDLVGDGQREFSIAYSAECSTKPRVGSTGPPESTAVLAARSGRRIA